MSACRSVEWLGLSVEDWSSVVVGAVLGLMVTLLYQGLVRVHRRWLLRKAFAGSWVRTAMSEYHLSPEVWKEQNKGVFGKEVRITVRSSNSLHVHVQYDDSRGIAEAVIELHGDGMKSGEGPYSYTREGDVCFGNAGWYSMHQVNEGKLHIYFTGRYPENTAHGYEVWERKKG